MQRTNRYIVGMVMAAMALLCSSCNITKFVPEDKFLLYKSKVEVTDTKKVDPTSLKSYLRQTPNSEILGFWKLQLHVYNTAPTDTTTKAKKRLARNAHRTGEAPEIYNDEMTAVSMQQLTQAMRNKGYFNAQVDTSLSVKDRKLSITYRVTAQQPYVIRSYRLDLPQRELAEIAMSRRSKVHIGDDFSTDVLNAERQRVASEMRRIGYYYFEKELLQVIADSSVRSHEVDVTLCLRPDIHPDTSRVFRVYSIRDLQFHIDSNLLREPMLRRTSLIKPGEVFNQYKVDQTYEKFNALGMVKYVDITFVPVRDHLLDCHITMSRNKLHSISAQVDGTYTGGDWGIAAELGYQHRNIFHGAELLTLKARGSYEWRQNGGRALEVKANAGLRFPNSLYIDLEGRYQRRPDEFNRIIANAGLGYTIHKTAYSPWKHEFKFLDISYVYLPWMAAEFRERFMKPNSLLKYSYEDHFIEAFSYTVTYSSHRKNEPLRSYGMFTLGVETAGNILALGALAGRSSKDADGAYMIGNIRFAQYAKFDFSFAGHHILDENNRFVFHGAVGVAVPFLNSDVMPFERRYYAGGANSVRGWLARTLGPGKYCSPGGIINYDNQVGDVRIDMSAEYRFRIWKFIHGAAFVDAGNIWTIRRYEQQEGGQFKWNEFYKQLALSYGLGLRLDLSFLILRLDLGVRLHDPALIDKGKQWRTVPNGLCWKDDFALHFAIGYPF